MTRRPAAITWIDTLKLTDADHRALVEELEASVQPATHEQRAGARCSYDLPGGALMKVFSSASPPVHYLVRPRNLSSGGIGVLHGNYLHVGTRCNMVLRQVNGQSASVSAAVAWCRHFRGRVHEIGIKFAQPIVVADFIDQGVRSPGATGSQALRIKRSGRALLVGGSIDDQELVRYYLTSMGVELHATADAVAALSQIESSSFQLLIMDEQLAGMNPNEFISALREQGSPVPVALMTAAPAKHASLTPSGGGGGADHGVCLLPKPFTVDDIVKVTSAHLPQAVPHETNLPVFSESWGCTDMRPVILGFLGRLQTQVSEMSRLAENHDAQSLLLKRCQDLKGSAGGYGYPQISRAAHNLLEALGSNARESITQCLNELTDMCEAAARVRSVDEEPAADAVASR